MIDLGPICLDWNKAQPVRMPNLKPTQTAISLRRPMLLERIKVAANKRDVPYQSLIKMGWRNRLRRADQGESHLIGSCTVTSLVPSGNVASTCTSWIISGIPSIT